MRQKSQTMWVWNTKELLLNENERKTFFDFCNRKNIAEVFFQLQLSNEKIGYQEEMRQFLKEATSIGIKVHGLDGHPSFALKENHPKVLAIVETVKDFNKSSSPEERFYGIHFDNEPYLLPHFQTAERRAILLDFLELNRKCADQARSGGLVYGIDIPFWFAKSFENIDKETAYIISVSGEEKPLSFHLIDICDNIGIMDYRNFASGPDGIIEHGLRELEYAKNKNKEIYIGVETSRYSDERIAFIYGFERSEFNKHFLKIAKDLEEGIYFEGFRLRLLDDGINIHAGLVSSRDEKKQLLLQETLLKLAEIIGKNLYGIEGEKKEKILFDIKWIINQNVEFRGFKSSEINNEKAKKLYLVFKTEEIMLPKISFARMSEKEFENVLSEAEEVFSKYPSFHGFAIHHYNSYRKLCNE